MQRWCVPYTYNMWILYVQLRGSKWRHVPRKFRREETRENSRADVSHQVNNTCKWNGRLLGFGSGGRRPAPPTEPRKCYRYMHTGVHEFWNAHPPSTASPFGRINLLIGPSQSTASKHRSPHSLRVTARVRVGRSASGNAPRPKPPYIRMDMYPVQYRYTSYKLISVYCSCSTNSTLNLVL